MKMRPAIIGLAALALVAFGAVLLLHDRGQSPGHPELFADAGAGVAYYTCSMDPQVRQAGPGACPICGMRLTPVKASSIPGGEVLVPAGRLPLMGIETAPAKTDAARVILTAPGRVAYDDARITDVTLRFDGYITDLHVRSLGDPVRKGQVLMTLYSPELVAAQQEYLLLIGRGDLDSADSILRAAWTRLSLLGLSEEQLRDILSRGEAVRDLPIIAPVSGYVVEKNVTRGAAVHAGDRLFRLASLDVVWVEADVPEADLPLVRAGQSARVVLPSLPGKTITGVVARVLPYLDEATRTGRVRIEVRNDGIELKPAMFANVQLDIDLGERLLVPASAVLYTGPRNLVFVDLGEGRFAPREIVIGQKVGDAYEVVSGLSDGDLVVTSGNFLIAAESRLRAGGEPVEDHAR